MVHRQKSLPVARRDKQALHHRVRDEDAARQESRGERGSEGKHVDMDLSSAIDYLAPAAVRGIRDRLASGEKQFDIVGQEGRGQVFADRGTLHDPLGGIAEKGDLAAIGNLAGVQDERCSEPAGQVGIENGRFGRTSAGGIR